MRRSISRRGTCLLLAGLLLASGRLAPADAASTTLVHSLARIGHFAAAGNVIAWGTKTRPAGNYFRPQWVYIRDVAHTQQSRFVEPTSLGPLQLAVGGRRVVWTDIVDVGPEVLMRSGALGASQRIDYPGAYWAWLSGGGPWRPISGMDGDRSLLAFAWYQWYYRHPDPCINGNASPGDCDEIVQKPGGIHMVEGRRRPSVPNVGPAWGLATAGDQVAYVPLAVGQKRRMRPPDVQLRTADTGALVATASWALGRPRALAMTRRRLAVLINDHGQMRIAIFRTSTGNQLASYNVNPTAGKQIDMSAAGVLFTTNSSRPQLRLLDPGTGARRTVANLRRMPVDFSLEGRHVRWAINIRGGGYIRQKTIS